MSRPEARPAPHLWLGVAVGSIIVALLNLALWIYQWFDRPNDGVEVFNWWLQLFLAVLFVILAIRALRSYARDRAKLAAAAVGDEQ